MTHWRVVYELKRAGVIRTRMVREQFATREEADDAADELRAAGFDAAVVLRGRPTLTRRHGGRDKHAET